MTDDKTTVKPEKRGWGYKSPNSVIEARVQEILDVLGQNPAISRYKLHKLFKDKWLDKHGNSVSWRTIDSYLARARAEILKRAKRDKADVAAELVARYEVDLASKDSQTRHRAALGLRELLGLDAPKRTQTDLTSNGQRIVTLTIDPKLVTGEDEPREGDKQI